MPDPDPLPRRCRRLLRAYPNWYRHERGQEILTTLLDAARPGQRLPSRHDVLDVLARAALCRLRPPRGLTCWFVTVTVALLAAAAAMARCHRRRPGRRVRVAALRAAGDRRRGGGHGRASPQPACSDLPLPRLLQLPMETGRRPGGGLRRLAPPQHRRRPHLGGVLDKSQPLSRWCSPHCPCKPPTRPLGRGRLPARLRRAGPPAPRSARQWRGVGGQSERP